MTVKSDNFCVFSFVPDYKIWECDDFIWKRVAPLWQQQPNSKWEFLFHAPDKGLVVFSCQCAEDGPAVCWWYWKQPNCLFKKLSNKETPKWNGVFSPIFCWRIWNLTGHHGGCSVKGLESWSLGRAVIANYLCPGWEVLAHLVLRQVQALGNLFQFPMWLRGPQALIFPSVCSWNHLGAPLGQSCP